MEPRPRYGRILFILRMKKWCGLLSGFPVRNRSRLGRIQPPPYGALLSGRAYEHVALAARGERGGERRQRLRRLAFLEGAARGLRRLLGGLAPVQQRRRLGGQQLLRLV